MNTSYAFVALVIAFGLAAFPAGAGGIYKWKDAQGNLHFSDTPPPDVKTKAGVDKVEVKGGYGNFNVSSKSPIRNPRPGSASLVSLSRFTLRPGSDGRAFTAGRAYSGRNCENSTDLIWDEGTVDVKGKALQNAVAERFRDAGYGLSVSEGGDLLPGSLDLEADLTDIKIDVCNTRMAGNSAGTGSALLSISVQCSMRALADTSLRVSTPCGLPCNDGRRPSSRHRSARRCDVACGSPSHGQRCTC